jgi:hypothetical protein
MVVVGTSYLVHVVSLMRILRPMVVTATLPWSVGMVMQIFGVQNAHLY